MTEKKYSYLVKKAKIQEDTRGLYHNPRIWMEGDDLEGFNGHLSYGFVKEPCKIHPKEGMIKHPYGEILIFGGINTDDILDLGAEISIELGEDGQRYTFDDPTFIVLPPDTPHGPITVESLDRPIAHFHVGLSAKYKAESVEQSMGSSDESNYENLVKRMGNLVSEEEKRENDMIDERGVTNLKAFGPANSEQFIHLAGDNTEGLDVNMPWGFYKDPGIWARSGKPHIHHEYDELLFFAGLDPDDLSYFGAEVEFCLGEEMERHIIDEPTAIVAPKEFAHAPLVTRWADDTFTHSNISLGKGYDREEIEPQE